MSRNIAQIILIGFILLGFGIRLYQLDVMPLRGDEAFSAMFWAEMPIHQSLEEIATIEPHPPLTYVIFHLWNLVINGIDSEFALRMLGVFGNLIAIPVMYRIGTHLTHKRLIGVLSAFVWAIHPFEIWHSQDFRNYAVWAGLSTLTLWFALRFMSFKRHKDHVLYFMLGLITAFTFYTELLTLGAIGLYVLIMPYQRKFKFKFLVTQVSIIICVLLGFWVLQGSLLGSGGYGGNVEPFFAPDYFTRFLPTLMVGDAIPIDYSGIWVLISILCVVLIFGVYRISKKTTILIMILILVPLISLGIISTRVSIFHPRYIISTIPAFILLLTIGIYGIATVLKPITRLNANISSIILIIPWLILTIITLNNYFSHTLYQKAPAWDELGEFLNKNVSPDDLVIQLSTDAAFGYYYRGKAEDIGLPASPVQPETEIIETLASAQNTYDSLYIVSNAIPDWQNSDVIENWANKNMQLVRLSNTSGLGIRQYKNWSVDEDNLSSDLQVKFDDTVELLDYKLFPSPLPTGELVLWLYWQPLQQTTVDLKTFVHITGETNPNTGTPLWSQDDQFPQNSRLQSTSWEVGTIYRDVYYLPAQEIKAGNYQVLIGWYNPQTNERLLTDADNDSYVLTSLTFDPN